MAGTEIREYDGVTEISVHGTRDDVESTLVAFCLLHKVALKHHDWDGSNFSAYFILTAKDGTVAELRYGCGGWYLENMEAQLGLVFTPACAGGVA